MLDIGEAESLICKIHTRETVTFLEEFNACRRIDEKEI